MIRASRVLSANTWDRAREADCIALAHDARHRRRFAMTGEGGTEFLLDLAEAAYLRDGDGLALDDGRIVRVVAADEPVLEIKGEAHLLARIAWHIGNRHVPAQILPDRIRIGRDHVLEQMTGMLGARVERTIAPFDPEPGAYSGEHGHAHRHAHSHHSRYGEHPHEH
jgi:urease accessory protein